MEELCRIKGVLGLPRKCIHNPSSLLNLCQEKIIDLMHEQEICVSDPTMYFEESCTIYITVNFGIPWQIEIRKYQGLPIPQTLINDLKTHRLSLERIIFTEDLVACGYPRNLINTICHFMDQRDERKNLHESNMFVRVLGEMKFTVSCEDCQRKIDEVFVVNFLYEKK